MEERMRGVPGRWRGEKMAVLRREFEISRKTGYKIFQRDKDSGPQVLTTVTTSISARNELPFQIETLIVRLREEYPTWGAPKIREVAAPAQ